MLVSIIIPCYNVEQYVSESLDSALNQSYKDIEIICVDNNSTDSTYSILQEYQKKYPDKITIAQEPQKGAPVARNTGIRLAKGEWIQFLDADDTIKPNKIAHQVTLIKEEGCFDFIIAPFERKNVHKGIYTKNIYTKNKWVALITGQLGCTVSNLFKKSKIIEIGGWNINLKSSQEAELMFRLLQNKTEYLYDHELLTLVRDREIGSITSSNPSENWKRFIELRFTIWEYLEANNLLSKEIETELKKIIFDSIKIIYFDNKEEAKKIYDSRVKGKFRVTLSPTTTNTYIVLHNLLGFSFTQELFSVFKKIKSKIRTSIR